MSKTDSSDQAGDAVRSESIESRPEPLEAANMTIVTSRKVIIDEATGAIRFEEPSSPAPQSSTAAPEPPAQPSPAAGTSPGAPSDADLEAEVTQQMPSPSAAALRKGAEKASAEKGGAAAPEKPSESPNKRLSAQTLFAFALPEPVRKELMKDAVQKSKAKSSASGEKSRGRLPLVLGLLGVVIAAAVAFFFLSDRFGVAAREESPPSQPAVVTLDTPSEQRSAAVRDDKPSEQSADTKSEVVQDANRRDNAQSASDERPAKSSSPAELSGLSDAELAGRLSAQSDLKTLTSAIKEAGARKKPELVEKLLALASHPDYLVRVSVLRELSNEGAYSNEQKNAVLVVLLERLDDTDELVRGFAARALGIAGDQTAVPKLRGRLDVEESDVVVKHIQSAIASLERK